MFRELLTPRLQRMIKDQGPDGPLAKQFLYSEKELLPGGLKDPIGDHAKQVAPGLIHRYKNRVLLFPTQKCPVHCRYCFRRNELETGDDLFGKLDQAFDYIANHDEVEEVILSGGDPLTLSSERLTTIFENISSGKKIRIHSRVPVISPELLDSKKIDLLHQRGVILVTHTNHSSEWDKDAIEVAKKLRHLTHLSQTVLLAGVNDNAQDLIDLYKLISKIGILPYYLHHPDEVEGGMHFWLSVKEGSKIYSKLRQELSGWQIPRYIIDSPDGTGKREALATLEV